MPKRGPARPKRTVRKKTKPKRSVRNGSTKRSTTGGLIATGIRTLVSVLPGSVFMLPLVDMVLSSFGFTPNNFYTLADGQTVAEGTVVHGLSGAICFKYSNILARAPGTLTADTGNFRQTALTPYRDGRLLNLTISADPDGQRQYRAGRWAIAFIPFRVPGDRDEFVKDYTPMGLERVSGLSGSVTGPSDRPLRLTFTPRTSDGQLSQFQSLDEFVGAVVVAFDCDVRSNYREFKPDEFVPFIAIKGKIEVKSPAVGQRRQFEFDDQMWTYGGRAHVRDSSGGWHTFSDNTVAVESDTVTYTGHRHVNLASMEM